MAMDSDTAKYLMALDSQIQGLWKSLKHHSNAAEHRERAREYQQKADRIEQQMLSYKTELSASIKTLHEESARYTNVVMVIGYAGYFATWGFTKDILGKDFTAFVGLMGMLSVAVFCLWEMFVILTRLQAVSELGQIFRNMISVEDFEPLRDEQMRREANRAMIIAPVHKLVFTFSLTAMAAGGLVMMHALYSSL